MELNFNGPIMISSGFGEPPEGVDVLWRAEVDRLEYHMFHGLQNGAIVLFWYRVKHRTAQGHARLESGKLCYLGQVVTRRRWACETKAEAIASLAERRKRQVGILRAQLQQAESELALANQAIAEQS